MTSQNDLGRFVPSFGHVLLSAVFAMSPTCLAQNRIATQVEPPQFLSASPQTASGTVFTSLKSQDSAATWLAQGLTSEVVSIAVDPINASIAYAADLGVLYKSTDGGAT